MDLKQYVTEFCKTHNISKSRLACHANIARSTLYLMMDSNSPPTLMNLTKLAIAMQVHPQYLIKLEWEKYQLSEFEVVPIDPLTEPMRWFHQNQDSAHFISETVADGSLVCTGEQFTKTWRLQNTGETVWKNRKLKCQDQEDTLQQQPELQPFTATRNFSLTPISSSVDIPTTNPGSTVDISVEFIAPTIPASVFSYWKMLDANDNICFPNCIGVYLEIQVVSAGAAESITQS